MSYTPTDWKTGDVITADKLNHAEAGIASAMSMEDLPGIVAGSVSDWLHDNLEPTEPPVDASLTISGAAADAKVAGDKVAELKSALEDVTDTTCEEKTETVTINNDPSWTAGYCYANGTIVNSSGYSYSPKIAVVIGDVVEIIRGSAGTVASMRTLCAYAGDTAVSEKGSDSTISTYTVPSGINYIRATISNAETYYVRVTRKVTSLIQKTDPLLILDRTLTESAGYISGTGSISPASASQLEVYTNKIKVVDTDVNWKAVYGDTYSTWIAYATYDKNEKFLSRVTLFTGNSSEENGSISPETGVHYIAFTYRTFGDCEFSVEVIPAFDKIIDASLDTPDIPRNVIRSSIGVNPFRFKPFMSHMYVGSDTPPIPNQSIYDIHNSKKLGFDVIEANVQKTSDNKYICYHGSSGKFATNVHHVDGVTSLTDIAINSVTLSWIQTNVRYNSNYTKYQTAPTTLEDFLCSCRMHQMIPMLTGSDADVIAIANKIMGKDNYISYGGTRATTSAPILVYASEATKEAILAMCDSYGPPFIYSMGNPTSFTDAQLKEIVDAVHAKGCLMGMASTYITYAETLRLLSLGFDMSASSFQVNDFTDGNVCNLYAEVDFSQFFSTGTTSGDNLVLDANEYVQCNNELWTSMAVPFMAKTSLRFRMNGSATVTIGGQDIPVASDGTKDIWLSAFIYNLYPGFRIKATTESTIYSLEYHASNV